MEFRDGLSWQREGQYKVRLKKGLERKPRLGTPQSSGHKEDHIRLDIHVYVCLF